MQRALRAIVSTTGALSPAGVFLDVVTGDTQNQVRTELKLLGPAMVLEAWEDWCGKQGHTLRCGRSLQNL